MFHYSISTTTFFLLFKKISQLRPKKSTVNFDQFFSVCFFTYLLLAYGKYTVYSLFRLLFTLSEKMLRAYLFLFLSAKMVK